MTDDRIEGAGRTGLGRIQDAAGGLIGDNATQAKGKLNEIAGKAQSTVGNIKAKAADGLHQARDKAEDTYGQVDRILRDQPLLGIGVGLALGAAIGLLLASARNRD
jgi:ElaB/YqjD/DUF883 family membrane-anchored ribosome-binding protein